ncbi:MAG: hydroxyacylglutathione hydrolase, partial [Methylococcales bacterium]
EIIQIPVLQDNYVYLIHESESSKTAVVDPAVAGPVLDQLSNRGWRLNYILNTHHHGDHVGGNLELQRKTGCRVVGSRSDCARIPGIDIRLDEGENFQFGLAEARVISVSGHTCGHIAYWFPSHKALFCGDTLFSMGCGRLFEGTPDQMWDSLSKLMQLPADTRVYCAHEYTWTNGRFALTLEPRNQKLQHRMQVVERMRRQNLPTVPSTLDDELATNPFLRVASPEIKKTLAIESENPVEVFAEIRRRKDQFH